MVYVLFLGLVTIIHSINFIRIDEVTDSVENKHEIYNKFRLLFTGTKNRKEIG